MKVLYLKPNRVVLEAENDGDRKELEEFEAWLQDQVELDPMFRDWYDYTEARP